MVRKLYIPSIYIHLNHFSFKNSILDYNRFMNLLVQKQKSAYYKILVTLLVLGIILVLSLSIVISISSEKHNTNIIIESDRRTLEQIAFSTNYIDNSAKVFAMALFTDNLIGKLYQENNLDLWEAVKIMNTLRVQVNGSSIVHSVYVYNKELQWIYSTNRKLSQPLDDFFDTDMKEIIQKNNVPERLMPVPRKIPHSDGLYTVDTNVFTYIMPRHPYGNDSFPTALIVNIDAAYLMEIIEQLLIGDSGEIIVINNTGKVIAHSDSGLFLNTLPSPFESVIKQLDRKSNGRFSINGKDQLVSMVLSKNSEWRFIKLSDYKEMMKPVIQQRILLIAIGFSFIIVVWILSFLFSKNLYKPIRELVRNVEKIGQLSSSGEMDQGELDFVASAFSDAIEKVTDLSSFRTGNVKALRSQFFKDLLYGKIENPSEIVKKMDALDSKLKIHSWFRILLIHLDGKKKYSTNENIVNSVNSVLQNALTIVSGLHLNSDYCETVIIDKENALIVVSSPLPVEYEQITVIHRETIKEINKAFQCSVTTALSAGGEGIHTLHEQFQETEELIEYRLVTGPDTLITIDDIEDRIDESLSFPLKEEKKLINSIKEANLDQCIGSFTNISSILKNFSYENIRLGYMRTASSIFDYLNSIESFSTESYRFRFSDFSKDLNECHFLSDIENLFRELLHSTCDFLLEESGHKPQQNINTVKEIIDKEFANPGMNLSMVAAMMHMSPVYLGRVFKQSTSQSFNNYLTSFRLRKASILLLETDKTIESISSEVGITNTRFFFTKFKSNYGVTPTQYRKKIKLREE